MAKNIYERLNIKDFSDENELLDEIIKKFDSLDRQGSIDIVAKSDLINFLFIELLEAGFNIAYLDFDKIGFDYPNTYILTISEDRSLWITKAYTKKGKPLISESEYLYMLESDISQDFIDKNIENTDFPILFALG